MAEDMLIRKKALKIQDRLGMRIGVPYGTISVPSPKTGQQALKVLYDLYRIGMRAYVLPRDLFSGIKTATDLYKTKYGELIKIKDEAKKYNIELALRCETLTDQPDEELKLYCTIARIMDCRMFIIKPNFYSRIMPEDQARRLVVHKVNEIISNLQFSVKIGIETTGTEKEVGSLEDVLDIVARTESTEPVINWPLLHARHGGALRIQRDYENVISKVKSTVDSRWMSNAYFFFAGASYGPSGFSKYIPLERSDMKLEHLIKTIMGYEIKGTLIIEDPNRDGFVMNMLEKLADMVR